jgi:type II secretory pathway component PulM
MYVPIVVVVVLAVWWLFIRPIGIARREQQEKQLRERQHAQHLEQQKRALEEMETVHWKETSLGGEMIVSRDVHFPTMRMHLEIRSRSGD